LLYGIVYVSYLQVSTARQGENGLGVEAQREACGKAGICSAVFVSYENADISFSNVLIGELDVRYALVWLVWLSGVISSDAGMATPKLRVVQESGVTMRAYGGAHQEREAVFPTAKLSYLDAQTDASDVNCDDR
jgi:hypothetical protein